MPPIPVPRMAPMRSRLSSEIFSLACSNACRVATTVIWVTRSSRRASLCPNSATGSKPLTSPANRVIRLLASKRVMGAMPERPARMASQVSLTVFPNGVSVPSPVMTTRFRSTVTSYQNNAPAHAGNGPTIAGICPILQGPRSITHGPSRGRAGSAC